MMRHACALFAMASLPACQSTTDGTTLALTSNKPPLATMVMIGKAIQRCWLKNPGKEFAGYRMSDETNSHAGRPRVLLVPRSNPAGLPSLVVNAEKSGGKTQVQAFGPLLSSATGTKIRSNITKWTGGDPAC